MLIQRPERRQPRFVAAHQSLGSPKLLICDRRPGITYTKDSSRTPDEIDARLREAAQRHKFGILNVQDLKATLQAKGIDLGSECRIYDVCNAQAATKALHNEMATSVVLPCRISVFTDGTGTKIATVKPTDPLRATGISGVEGLATEVERGVVAIIDEAA